MFQLGTSAAFGWLASGNEYGAPKNKAKYPVVKREKEEDTLSWGREVLMCMQLEGRDPNSEMAVGVAMQLIPRGYCQHHLEGWTW